MQDPKPIRVREVDRIVRSHASSPSHPIRRVRDALKHTPEELGLRQYSTSARFAEFLGCSSSYVRNVECGITANWTNLALRVEEKTQVSSDWLLSDPDPTAPIMSVHGKEWNPTEALDPLARRKGMPEWRMLMRDCPEILPGVIARMVEAQLSFDLAEDQHDFLVNLVLAFEKRGTFTAPELEPARREMESVVAKGLLSRAWREDSSEPKQPT